MTHFDAQLPNEMTDYLEKIQKMHHLKNKSEVLEFIIKKYRKELS